MEQVILVNEADEDIGVMEKMEAHQKGVLHRAFSVFLFNDEQKLLLQRRASHKYHSGGLWTNTCCSHPRPGETILEAATRRLEEEMGIRNVSLSVVDHILYKVDFENGLTEHEYDYIVEGVYNRDPVLNLEEADHFRWVSFEELNEEVNKTPDNFTYWFRFFLKNKK
jgi:isopentenyl-diphosphate delta-isomerase